jgi:hypothetical protein
LDLWHQLNKITKLESTALCRRIPPSYEKREGRGEVILQDKSNESLIFFEKGKWQNVHSKKEIPFTNVFRWHLAPETGLISLEHLRFGIERPVFLFSLTQVDDNFFKSLKPHEYKEDAYFGSILFDEHYIHLNWRILGPKKNVTLSIIYS